MRITDNTALQQNIAETKKYIKISTTTIETELAAVRTALTGKQDTLTFDSTPTQNSNNPVKSDGIYDSEKDIYAVMGEMGAKNLIPYPYKKLSTKVRGITWSDNGDGGIVGNGTGESASSQPYCEINGNQTNNEKDILLKAGKWYVLTCKRTSEYAIGANVYFLNTQTLLQTQITFDYIYDDGVQLQRTSNNIYMKYEGVQHDKVAFKLPQDMYAQMQIRYEKGTNVSVTDDVQYPMLRLASDTDDTYQRYAKTNKQLTDEIANKVDKVEGKGLSENDYTDAEKTKLAGLSNYDDTALTGRMTAAETAIAGKVDNSKIGVSNGIASLDSTGKVPSTQLPSYVDDVLEYASLSAFPTVGETGKIYIALNTNKTYRWSGTKYVEISQSLAIGETSSTAYAGNKGKANANAITAMKNGSSIDSFGDVETALGNKVDKVKGKGLSTNDYSDTEKGKVADNTSAIAELTEETSGVWDSINGVYIGRDLTVVFASEIADYSDEWTWIQARLDAHDVSGLRVGDYIPINIAANGGIAAETHKAEIAGINTYRRTGDNGHEVGYHIDWITRDCYSGTVQFNTSNNNNGNASNSSPFLASNLKSWLDGTLYPLLDAKLKAVIKAKRILAPYRYQSGATLTDDNSWAWQDFDKLWVPLETEIFDCLAWSTKGYGNGQAVQYPIFANSYEHRMKGAGPGGARANWWTASANSGNSTNVVSVGSDGGSNYSYASYAFCMPVCFRTMEA